MKISTESARKIWLGMQGAGPHEAGGATKACVDSHSALEIALKGNGWMIHGVTLECPGVMSMDIFRVTVDGRGFWTVTHTSRPLKWTE